MARPSLAPPPRADTQPQPRGRRSHGRGAGHCPPGEPPWCGRSRVLPGQGDTVGTSLISSCLMTRACSATVRCSATGCSLLFFLGLSAPGRPNVLVAVSVCRVVLKTKQEEAAERGIKAGEGPHGASASIQIGRAPVPFLPVSICSSHMHACTFSALLCGSTPSLSELSMFRTF